MKRVLLVGLLISYFVYTIAVYNSEYTSGSNKDVVAGKKLFQKYNCIACHQIYGLGGYIGPDLTNVISAKDKGEQYTYAFIKTGSQRMPRLGLEEKEINNIINYLKSINKTGQFPIRGSNKTTWGSFTINEK